MGQVVGGATYPIGKIALSSFDPFTLAFLRFTIASVTLLALVYLQGSLRRIERGDWVRLISLGILAIPLNQLLFLYGLNFTTPARSALYFAATPIFVFILAVPFLKEKATVPKLLGIAASFIGVAIVIGGGDLDKGVLYGDILVLLAVMAWAAYTIVGKSLSKKYGALLITAYALSLGTLIYLPFGIYSALRFDYSHVNLDGWLSLLYLAIGTSVVFYTIWYWALARMEASKLAIFENIQLVIAALFSVWLVGETFGLDFYIGGAMVIAGVFLTQRG